MKTPVLIVNFKAYESAVGENAVALAKICEKVAMGTKASIIVAVQIADVYRVAQAVKIPVFAQHIDDNSYGSYTGSINAETAMANGAIGTLLNHSEKRLRLDILENSVKRAKEAGLITVVCANNPKASEIIAGFNPDFVAVEPPELIGGDISVSTAKPEVVSQAVSRIAQKPCNKLIVGAGIKTAADVKKSIELGAVGILVASGVTQAKDKEKAIRDLVSVF
jgi:triosephosphate isomerase (TIM)